MSWLGRLAVATSRTREDARRLGDARAARAMHVLFTGILIILLGVFVPIFVKQFHRWNNFTTDVELPTSLWKTYYGSARCGPDSPRESACPASHSSPLLWTSPFRRDDPSHEERASERMSDSYWIGVSIPTALLREAYQRRANQLLLGWLLASYRVWVDGQYLTGGTGLGNRDSHPLMITVPLTRLAEPRPLEVAIRVYHDSDVRLPDYLNQLRGGEGFVTSEGSKTFRDFIVFWETVRPFSLLIVYTVIASIFFSFWVGSKSKPEFFYIALFALVSAFHQARTTSIFATAVSHGVSTDLDLVLRFYVASFGMALGFSFARARLAFFRFGLPLALAVPFLLLFTVPDSRSKLLVMFFIKSFATPAFYGAAGLVCALQAHFLFNDRALGPRSWSVLRPRARRLALFALGMLALAVFHVLQSRDLLPAAARMIWMGLGFEHFVFVVYFGSILLSDHRDERHGRTAWVPPSQPLLAPGARGALLALKLEASAQVTAALDTHLLALAARQAGAVVNRAEDGVFVYFDEDACDDPAAAALRLLDELCFDMLIVGDRFGEPPRLSAGLTPCTGPGTVARATSLQAEGRANSPSGTSFTLASEPGFLPARALRGRKSPLWVRTGPARLKRAA